MVSGSLSSPRQGFFPSFSRPTEFTIGRQRVFSLTGWSPWIQSGFHVTRPTQVPSGRRFCCRVRGCHPLWPAFPCRSANRPLCNSHVEGPTTPQRKPLRFGLFPFRSPLLRESIFLSIPPVTEMFQFAGLAAQHLCIQCRLIRVSRN